MSPAKKKAAPAKKAAKEDKPKFSRARLPKLLKGMKDVLPADQPYWDWIRSTIGDLSRCHGVERLDTPTLEEASLFEKGTGKSTDIVEKEMYSFADRDGKKIALRPEFTPSFARAYIEHGMLTMTQPVKLFGFGPVFRRDNPQAGRYRQHTQWSVEFFGSEDPIADAQLILLSHSFYKDLGLEAEVQINSVGHEECRAEYKKQLAAHYRSKRSKLCEDCKRRLTKNPLRLLDCKVPGCQEVRDKAPQIVDWLCGDCKDHFMLLLEYLDEMDIPYQMNPYLVRGMDYYTHTVFEWYVKDAASGAQTAIGGGGRYDGLIELYSGQPTAGIGFALGIERVILRLKEKGIEPPARQVPEVYITQLGTAARRKALVLFEEFRKEGILVAEHFAKSSLKSQLELANKLDAKYVLILGQKEVLEGTALIRDMDGGIQESVALDKAVSEIKKKLKK